MQRKRREMIRGMAGAAALVALPSVVRSAPVLPARHVVGAGTAGCVLAGLALRNGSLPPDDSVFTVDRGPGGGAHPLVWNALRERKIDVPDLAVVAALGGRDGGRIAAEIAQRWARYTASANRTAIFVMPYAFEHTRYQRAQLQLPRVAQSFQHILVMHNEAAVGDPLELWSAVHDRANANVLAALSATHQRTL